ncbi:MAG: hypothetical protein J6B77_04190 [Clostridia bacterium]|nr:hypothetical protein [Clostridia bacterium]
MAFEQYKQVYCGEGLTLRPKAAPQSITFHLKKKEHKTYRLFTVGETEQFYFWKNEPDSQFLYRMLTDALDTEHAIRDRYCLDLSCKKYENYLKRVYKKVAWPPVLSYLHMVNLPTAWEFGLTVSAKDLTFSKGGYLRMRIDIRLRKEGVDPRSIEGDPDKSITIDLHEGTYHGLRLNEQIEIPKNTAHVGVFIEGIGYKGQCYIEQPYLSANGQNLLPAFTESTADREHLDWVAQFLSRKEWPEFRVRLNGTVIHTGEIFERCHRYSEWELALPEKLLREENVISYELISDYHDPLPYTIYELGVIEQENAPISILSVSEAAPANGKARVLVRTNRPNLRVTFTPLSDQLSGKSELFFREAGLHGILLDCGAPCAHAAFRLTTDGFTAEGEVGRIVCRTEDLVMTGTGDMIYIRQDQSDMEEYLSWYLANHIGDLVTIRPAYRWSGTRVLNPDVWKRFRRLMRELQMQYVLMADGREIPGLSAQPDEALLAGRGFHGIQMHERDGAQYYWGKYHIESPTKEMMADLFYFSYKEHPFTTGSQYGPSYIRFVDGEMYLYANRILPADNRLAHEQSVASLRAMRRDRDTRHTGPSSMFKYLAEAGFSWLGAETMYSTMEPLMGFLRGTAREYKMARYGVHHAVQWSSTPHESPARYRRYRLALYASYLLGATDINTEEGLWRLEEYYEHHHRFSTACRAHLKEQQDFYRYTSTHSRTGTFHHPVAFLHGRDDGAHFFGRKKPWGLLGENKTPAEESWELITAFYPKANPANAVYRHGCPEDVPQGYHSGTPYGNLDAIPAEGSLKTLKQYRALLLLGYNRCTAEDAKKLLSYLRGGGKLLLSRAHLTMTSDLAAIRRGDLAFEEHALNLADGLPVFAEKTVNGTPLSVCVNAKSADEVLAVTDDGTPLVVRYRIGKGEILLFNTKEYPSHPAIRALYETEMQRFAESVNAEEPVFAETGDDVEFAVYTQADNTRHVYFLATDWYRDPAPMRHATLRVGTARYDVSLPFGVLLKCVSDGASAVFAETESGEVLSLTGDAVTVQGTGVVPFTAAQNGVQKTVSVDFTDASVKTLRLSEIFA